MAFWMMKMSTVSGESYAKCERVRKKGVNRSDGRHAGKEPAYSAFVRWGSFFVFVSLSRNYSISCRSGTFKLPYCQLVYMVHKLDFIHPYKDV
ncbi:MAG: hypothetical protein CVU00_14350 [Bacteroidetes bacterium HGW-Bacteroidetes-17]|jgi:hypothetical protein|nr:MAG: hypothetical protein CVU00_14350 [Bacteroidetes bacterium HGW-Bacteroidetes-17]